MRNNNIHRIFAGLLAMIVIMCAVVIGWASAAPEPEQTKEPAEAEAEPLVINMVQSGDDMLLTVIREDETVFQYSGDIDLWKAADGKAYGIIYLDEEVLQ